MKPIIDPVKVEKLFDEPYKVLNIFFAFVIVSVFVYSLLFAGKEAGLHCQYKIAYGKECPSCGLTRSFKAIVTGNADEAMMVNAGSLWIFGFFASQLLMRISAIYASSKKCFKEENMIWCDAVASIFLLIICFGKGYNLF